jgi:hypothetical protein
MNAAPSGHRDLLLLLNRSVAISLSLESADVVEALLAARVSAEVDPCFVLLASLCHRGRPSIPAGLNGHLDKPQSSRAIRKCASGHREPTRPGVSAATKAPGIARVASRPSALWHHPGITFASMSARIGNVRGGAGLCGGMRSHAGLFSNIGETGFEPATARPPAECATRLRHSPWLPAF